MNIYYVYNQKNKFVHAFQFTGIKKEVRLEILNWLKESNGKYNVDFIYWGLKFKESKNVHEQNDPEIFFGDNDLGMAFKLIWL